MNFFLYCQLAYSFSISYTYKYRVESFLNNVVESISVSEVVLSFILFADVILISFFLNFA